MKRLGLLSLAAALLPAAAWGAEPAGPAELADLSLEELLAQQVTSAAKKPQRLSDTAAAVTVISQDAIAQSSARTLTDLLRMVPGFEVSEVQPASTAVSARGFASRYAANLLVMVDGAAVYGSSLSGVFWDQALVPLQNIERIEVIRGPGGALWGSNSINGVVNIITKHGIDTQGVRADVKLGLHDLRAEGSVGVQFSDKAYAHVYATHRRRTTYARHEGEAFRLDSAGSLAGARLDYSPTPDDTIVALAEVTDTRAQDVFAPYELRDGVPVLAREVKESPGASTHMLARWTHRFSPDFDLTVQGYYNHLERDEWSGGIDRTLYDLSLEGRWQPSDRHEFNFGLSGRRSREFGATQGITSGSTDHWLTGYVQDEVRLIPGKLTVTLGSKFELNDFGASNVQPSAHALYHLGASTKIWASVSRAVRTPLLIARNANFTYGNYLYLPPLGREGYIQSALQGNPDARSETLVAYEAGVRGKLAPGWAIDVSAFYNRYRHMATQDVVSIVPIVVPGRPVPLGLAVTVDIGNGGRAEGLGLEAMVSGNPAPWWQLEASYAYLRLDQDVSPGTTALIEVGASARHQVRLRNTFDLSPDVRFSSFAHYVGPAADGRRKGYAKLDLRLSWYPDPRLEISAVGTDLLDKRRVEAIRNPYEPTSQVYVERTGYLEARLRF